jgi:hypothetical protein
MEKKKIYSPCRESNLDSSAVRPVALSLYRLNYTGSSEETAGINADGLLHCQYIYSESKIIFFAVAFQ